MRKYIKKQILQWGSLSSTAGQRQLINYLSLAQWITRDSIYAIK
jgi:hypothetical protein